MKTQTKLAIFFFLASMATIVVLSASVYYFIIQYSFTDFYKRLEIRGVVTAKAQLDQEEASQAVLQEVRRLHLERLPEEKEYFIPADDGELPQTADSLGLPLNFFHQILQEGEATHQKENTFYAGILYQGKQDKYLVIVSANNYHNLQLLSHLRNGFLLAILIVSLLALSMAIAFSKKVFQPVKAITRRVMEISSKNLHLRLEDRKVNDEISELSSTFNNMLDRLETAFETQNNFISNASHELNTPLTSIIGQTDVTLAKERTKQEYVETLTVVQREAGRLEKITKSLLFLAQTGLTGKALTFDKVRMDQLLWDVKETIDKMNPRNKVQLNFSLMPDSPELLKVKGNNQLLHLALSNLINNACKYSNNQAVIVSIAASGSKVILVVKDQGIGIPEDELKFIFDPFFRGSNTKAFEGYGIGLPLTRNILRLHQADLEVVSTLNKGTTVQVVLPTGHYTLDQ
ncbi:MAG: HAMP domain-containing protein [Cyclobacteriaceae bacterium]|nr:HAMP domain-containing protein [Cyclobacteriaceae bacterium]